MARDRFHKGDRVVALAPVFAAAAVGLIPAGTTGTVTHGGRFTAQVVWDVPDRHGNPVTASGELPYPTARVGRA